MPDMSDDGPVTRSEFHREFREFESRIVGYFANVDTQFAALRSDITVQFNEVYTHLDGLAAEIRRARFDRLEREVRNQTGRQG